MKYAKQRRPKGRAILDAFFYERLRFLDEMARLRTKLKKRLIEEATGGELN